MAQQKWSERSQSLTLKEWELREQLAKFSYRAELLEREITEGEEALKRQTQTFDVFEHGRSRSLREDIGKIETVKQELQLCCQRRDALQREIDGLAPSCEQAAERRRGQDRFAELAGQRLKIDKAVDGKLGELRGLLLKRQELTERLNDAAGPIDLSLFSAPDYLDTERFQALWSAISLSGDFSSKSVRWLCRILGQEVPGGCKTYRVRRRLLTLRETLAEAGVYRAGDEIALTEEEAKEVIFGLPGRGRIEVDRGFGVASETGPPIVLK